MTAAALPSPEEITAAQSPATEARAISSCPDFGRNTIRPQLIIRVIEDVCPELLAFSFLALVAHVAAEYPARVVQRPFAVRVVAFRRNALIWRGHCVA